MDAVALARSFGLAGPARLSDGPVARGRRGEVWQLQATGDRWAVKVPFGRVSEDDVDASTRFQEAAHAAGVPTPAVRRTLSGGVFSEAGGMRARLHEWVDVGRPDALMEPTLVGTTLAALHGVPDPGPAGRPDSWHTDAVGAARWDDLVRRLTAASAPFADRLAALRDELVALEGWLEPPATVRTCHRDLWADNLLPAADGGACVLDWEDSGPADPDHELACVLFEFGRTDAGRARALVDAYEQAGGRGRVERRGHFTMLIAQLGHITATAAADWLAPNRRSPDRADAEAWVVETLDDPHTREVLDRLLGWVAERPPR